MNQTFLELRTMGKGLRHRKGQFNWAFGLLWTSSLSTGSCAEQWVWAPYKLYLIFKLAYFNVKFYSAKATKDYFEFTQKLDSFHIIEIFLGTKIILNQTVSVVWLLFRPLRSKCMRHFWIYPPKKIFSVRV